MGMKIRDWFRSEKNDEKMHKLFYNMSTTMKYIHSYDYYISSFNLSEIEINNPESLTPIQYNHVEKLEENESQEKINRNIYVLALMQVGAYTNTLDNLNEKFVKEHFNEFEMFLPEDTVPYLRGVIQRNSPVYYCDYVNERNKREVEKLENEIGEKDGSGNGLGMRQVKASSVGMAYADKETQKLYSSLDEKQAAFTGFLILPLIMILIGIVFAYIILFIQ